MFSLVRNASPTVCSSTILADGLVEARLGLRTVPVNGTRERRTSSTGHEDSIENNTKSMNAVECGCRLLGAVGAKELVYIVPSPPVLGLCQHGSTKPTNHSRRFQSWPRSGPSQLLLNQSIALHFSLPLLKFSLLYRIPVCSAINRRTSCSCGRQDPVSKHFRAPQCGEARHCPRAHQ